MDIIPAKAGIHGIAEDFNPGNMKHLPDVMVGARCNVPLHSLRKNVVSPDPNPFPEGEGIHYSCFISPRVNALGYTHAAPWALKR
ncbi:MAG: hypothetical protein ACE15F_01460 [bacterium]